MTMLFDRALSPSQVQKASSMDPPWRHHFHFRNFSTGGEWDERHMEYVEANLPSFKGKSVLDIGFCDGYYSFKAEVCGAKRVVGVDVFYRPSARLVQEVLDSKVEFYEADVSSWEGDGVFDVVLCLGLFYHVPDLHALLKKCADLTNPGGVAVFEGPVMGGRINRILSLPRLMSMAPSPGLPFNHHFWRPTLSTLTALLKVVGFDVLNVKWMWGRTLVTARRR